MKGNPITNVIIFAMAEVFGVLIGEKVVHILAKGNSKRAMLTTVVMILICSSIIKFFNPNEKVLMIVYLTEIFFIGNAFNLLFTI